MNYPDNEKSTGLDVITSIAGADLILVGDVSDSGKLKAVTKDNAISDVGLTINDNTTNDVSTAKHGFAPKLPDDDTKFLDGKGNYTVPPGLASVNASTTVKGIVQEATQAQVNAGTTAGSTGARLFVNPSTLLSLLNFTGTGSDGAIAQSSGSVSVDLLGAKYVVKQYSSLSITGTGQLKFINPHPNGTILIIKVQGLFEATSSTIPNLDASGCGAAGGAGGLVAGTLAGANGKDGIKILDTSNHYGIGATSNAATTGGSAFSNLFLYTKNDYQLLNGINLATGSGGGGGGATTGNGSGGTVTGTANGGDGGAGGGALIIQCDSVNFTSALGISVAGKDGSAGGSISSAVGANGVAGSGGGGGSGGMCVLIYNTSIAITGTVNNAGGAGGNGGAATNTSGGVGGGSITALSAGSGAGSYGGAGGNGAIPLSNTSSDGNNGTGGAGVQAGGGGGSGAGIVYNISATKVGGTGGAGGASDGGVIAKNYGY